MSVRAAHLLIKHTGSRNPVSRRTGEAVTMSPEDAMAELQEYEKKIRNEGVDTAFPMYAEQRSDCSSFRNKGDLGDFGRGEYSELPVLLLVGRRRDQPILVDNRLTFCLHFFFPSYTGDMQKPFEDASFALQPGQMSGIVSTDSGYHLIYRIA